MTTEELLEEVQARGLKVVLADGEPRLRGDRSRLSPTLLAVLKWHRPAIVERLTPIPKAEGPPEDVAIAIAERAYFDEPDWNGNHTAIRESVILRCEGFPTVAISVEEYESWKRHDDSIKTRRAAVETAKKTGPVENTFDFGEAP
jgi:hypothetical protein